VATYAGWPTTTTTDAKSSGALHYSTASGRHSGTTLTDAARLAGWSTPRAAERQQHNSQDAGLALSAQAGLASWPTASARDWKDSPGMAETGTNPDGSTRSRLDQLPRVAQLATPGPTSSGSPVATERPGQLSPVLSCWLMGYPLEWLSCAPPVPSRRGRRC
jgi:hypothetical protein